VRITGCPNGCARPYMAELGFVGDGPKSYQVIRIGAYFRHHFDYILLFLLYSTLVLCSFCIYCTLLYCDNRSGWVEHQTRVP
jgi:hypothetical protein